MADRMIPSSNPGHHWAMNAYKSSTKKGVVIVSAQEGILETRDGFRSFKYEIPNSRNVRDVLPCPRLTNKKKQEMLDDLQSRMNEAGLLQ